MPGKTMVGGAAYDVVPGNVMVGGTVYTIKEGKTMVGGTAYSIKFASDVVVTITGKGNRTYSYITIYNTKYTSAATAIVPAGTEIHCYGVTKGDKGGVFLNGKRVDSVGNYTFNADSDVSINLYYDTRNRYGKVEITTT